jgi:hypothetical protein
MAKSKATETAAGEAPAAQVKATESAPAPNSKYADKAKGLFKDHPSVKELHFTSDGLAFFEKNDAQNHALGLKEKEIETIQK